MNKNIYGTYRARDSRFFFLTIIRANFINPGTLLLTVVAGGVPGIFYLRLTDTYMHVHRRRTKMMPIMRVVFHV